MLTVLLLSWITSSAQTGNFIVVNGDTLTCYTKPELEQIATRVVRARECDSLLIVTEMQLEQKEIALQAKDQALAAKDSVISTKDTIINLKEEIILGKDEEISDLRKQSKRDSRQKLFLKIGWATTSAVFTGVVISLSLK